MFIRTAVLDDLAAIRRLALASPTAAHWTHDSLEKLFDVSPRRLTLVAEISGTAIGFLVALAAREEWEIENVVVGDRLRRKGIGGALLQSFVETAKVEGATGIVLEVRESNLPARSLYEKHGFGLAGRRKAYYSHPEEDALIYSLAFSVVSHL